MSLTTHWPDIEEILGRLRDWAFQVRDEVESLPLDQERSEASAAAPVGLVQVIEQFTALRHEVKLSTKSARGLEERSAAVLGGLEQAIAAMRSVEPREAEAAQRAAQPLVQTLAELDEALQRCRAVVENARRRIVEESAAQLLAQLDRQYRGQPWGVRWLAAAWYRRLRQGVEQHFRQNGAAIFDALLTGYELVQNRLRRAMAREQLVRLDCVGKPVDPHTMTVVEAVDDPSHAPGTVIEEIRPGYLWKGKVFQYAEVRAVRQPRVSAGAS